MFDRHRFAGVLLAAIFAGAVRLPAQNRVADSTLGQRWVAAELRLARLKAEAARNDSIVNADRPSQEIVEDIITIRYDSTLIGRATVAVLRNAARSAAKEIRAVQGDGATRTIGSIQFVALPTRQDGDPRRYVRLRPIVKRVGLDEMIAPMSGFESPFRRYFLDIAAAQATALADLSLSRWVTPVLPPTRKSEEDWTEVAGWVLGAQSEAVKRCINGSALSCGTVLGLEEYDDKLAAFYGPSDYPSLVEAHGVQEYEPDSVAMAVNRCIRGADEVACARMIGRVRVGDPLPAQSRLSLVAVALEHGGAGAAGRYLATTGTIRERLAAASGVPTDTLLLLWRDRVLASRPSHNVTGAAFAGLGWSLLLLFVSMRRPRCG